MRSSLHIRIWLTSICSFLILSLCSSSYASDFSVAPVYLTFDGKNRIQTLNIINKDSKPVTLRMQIMNWQQEGNNDIFSTVSHDLVTSPPIVIVPAKQTQLLRVALRRAISPKQAKELSYRLIVQEMPKKEDEVSNYTVKISVRMIIPIFIKPGVESVHKVTWQAQRMNNGQIHLTAHNIGNVHMVYNQLAVATAGKTQNFAKNVVILADNERSWTVPQTASQGRNLNLVLTNLDGTTQQTIAING